MHLKNRLMTKENNSKLHGLLNSTNLLPQKASLILGFTAGRSESSKDMTEEEALSLIAYLKDKAKETTDTDLQNLRRKIISIAHQMYWYLPNTRKIDMVRINNWCTSYGKFKKELNAHSYNELVQLVTQFKVVYASYIRNL